MLKCSLILLFLIFKKMKLFIDYQKKLVYLFLKGGIQMDKEIYVIDPHPF